MKTTKLFSALALVVFVALSACNALPTPPPGGPTIGGDTIVNTKEPIPQGDGTLESPFNASQAKEIAAALDSAEQRSDVYVRGYISAIKKVDTSYGNAEYSISDDGKDENQLAIYRGYYLNGDKFTAADQIKVGDDVIVLGTIVNYKGNTQQITTGSKIIKLNGQEGEKVDYANVPAKTVEEFIAAADKANYYKLTGTVSKFNAQYCSFDLTDATGAIYVYSVDNKAEWSSKISDGGTVVLAGKYDFYESKNQHEVVNAQILEFTNGEGGETQEPIEKPATLTKVTIAEFLTKPVNDTDWYELTGEIISIASASYGNVTIKDETGEVYIYGITSEWIGIKNDQSFAKLNLKTTDVITIGTKRAEYNGTPQGGGNDVAAYYISHTAGAGENYPAGSVILTFPDDNKENNKDISAYDKPWIAKIGSNEFNIENFNNNKWANNWTYIKCGRKSDPSVAKISNTSAMPKCSAVVVTIDNFTKIDKVNSIVMNVFSDAEKTQAVTTAIAPKEGINLGAQTFEIPVEKQAANLYYELVFNCAADGSKNGIIQVSKVVYVAAK